MVLVTHYADCVPLFFVDKEKHVIGLAHSLAGGEQQPGWGRE